MSNGEVTLDMSEEGGRAYKRRRKKHWSADKKEQIRRRLQRVGFSSHEISLWLAEEIPPGGRVGQNLILARRKIVRDFERKGFSFRDAVRRAENDRIDSTIDSWDADIGEPPEDWSVTRKTDPDKAERLAEDNIWGTLYVLGPSERKISGPRVLVR